MNNLILKLFSHIMTAVSSCSLYDQEHPAILHHAMEALKLMEGLFEDDVISITMLGDGLIVNNISIKEKSSQILNLQKKMKRKGIEKIVIKRGVTADELKTFMADISRFEPVPGNYANIATGIVSVKLKSDNDNLRQVMDQNIGVVGEVHQQLSRYKTLDMVSLEEVVMSFISTLKHEGNVLRIVSPVKAYNEYTYAHITNVAVLTIFQAEALGLKGDLLHETGLAGLLHDIGKMYISNDIIDKTGKLDAAEWAEMKKHPQFGAMHLSTLPDIPEIAVIGAFEHHMKFDGTGYPETKRRGKKQHVISQLIAIADFFDALRTERPYRKALELPVIIGLITDASGKEFNPLLVENFLSSLKRVGAM